jgi:hypothetical protein
MASDAALARAEEKVEKLQARQRSARRDADEETREAVGGLIQVATGFGLGKMRKERVDLTIAGVHHETWAGPVAYAAGVLADGDFGTALKSVGMSAASIRAYRYGMDDNP